MTQFLGFGTGNDGSVPTSGTDAPIDAPLSSNANAGSTSISATNAAFTAGQIIVIIQMWKNGVNSGLWELAQIASYSAGTITLRNPLVNSYVNPGAQVVVLKNYSGGNLSGDVAVKAFDGSIGGLLAWMISGSMLISAGIRGIGKGFRNGATEQSSNSFGYGGEGITGVTGGGGNDSGNNPSGGGGNNDGSSGGNSQQYYSGGGGAGRCRTLQNDESGAGGGGGGHVYGGGGGAGGVDSSATSNRNGGASNSVGGGNGGAGNSSAGGNSGAASDGYSGNGGSGFSNQGPGGGGGGANFPDLADGSKMVMGGGGGGGSRYEGPGGSSGGRGGNGGPIILLFVRDLKVTGLLEANGEQGQWSGASRDGNGGGGAGGFTHIKALTADIGTNLIQCNGGIPGSQPTYGGQGGYGSAGRIRIEACNLIGSTNQGSISLAIGGHAWCGQGNIMM